VVIGPGSVAQSCTTPMPIHYASGNNPTNMPGHKIRGVAGVDDFPSPSV
jgi:hypothetical protein